MRTPSPRPGPAAGTTTGADGDSTRRWSAWTGWTVAAVCLALCAAGTQLVISLGRHLDSLVEVLTASSFVGVGVLIVSHRGRNAVGWLFAGMGLVVATLFFSRAYVAYGHGDSRAADLPAQDWAAWAGVWPIELTLGLLCLILLLFPSGGLPSPGWRPLAVAVVSVTAVLSLASALADVNLTANFDYARHPLDLLPVAVAEPVYRGAQVLMLLAVLACLAAVVLRLRRAAGDERQQLKWLTYGAAVTVSAIVAGPLVGIPPVVGFHLFVPILPLAAGAAILRYHLYDIDHLINRTVVYALLSVLLVGAYVAIVNAASAVLARGRGVSLVATGLVAVAFGPLRQRLQKAVDHLLYGERDDPYEVVSRLVQRMETTTAPEAVLPSVAETVGQALRVPYAAIELQDDGGSATVASWGRPAGEPVSLPFGYDGKVLGRLVVGRRGASEDFSAADHRLLEGLAQHAGVAAQALRLTTDLQRSRRHLVTAREEERRRLRRDLHDGLGPVLAGAALQLDLLSSMVTSDPAAIEALAAKLKAEIQGAITEIRRLVYDLRPPALDELGLVGAIRQQATRFSSPAEGLGMAVSVEADDDDPVLPAAVEVAAYRIVTEALTNASRHGRGRACTVRLCIGRDLDVEVEDDGRGLAPEYRAGVGLTSMRERAVELGGFCTVEGIPSGGTRVSARLPLLRV